MRTCMQVSGPFDREYLILGGEGDCVGRKGRRETSLRACEFNVDVTDAVIGLVAGLLARGCLSSDPL